MTFLSLSFLLLQVDPSGTLVAIAFNVGLVAVLVQLATTKFKPWLNKNGYDWAIPIIAMGLGAVSGYLMQQYGIDIDPITGIFSGALAAGGYKVIRVAARGK